MCEFTQGIRGSYQNTGVMLCSVVTYKYEIDPGFETSPEFFLTYVDMYVISTQKKIP